MTKEDSDEKYSFQIEGKDYIISKKSKPQKKDPDPTQIRSKYLYDKLIAYSC